MGSHYSLQLGEEVPISFGIYSVLVYYHRSWNMKRKCRALRLLFIYFPIYSSLLVCHHFIGVKGAKELTSKLWRCRKSSGAWGWMEKLPIKDWEDWPRLQGDWEQEEWRLLDWYAKKSSCWEEDNALANELQRLKYMKKLKGIVTTLKFDYNGKNIKRR